MPGHLLKLSLCSIVLSSHLLAIAEQPNLDWSYYGGSLHGLQYSALDQINPDNVEKLEPAWIYRSGELGEGTRRGFTFQTNPVLVEGLLHISTGSGIVIALNPATGTEVWRHNPKLNRQKPTSETANRGVTLWRDPLAETGAHCSLRAYIGILDGRLLAMDGKTGEPCTDFGTVGEINLSRDARLRQRNYVDYNLTSPPIVVGDTLISGSAIGDNTAVEVELGIVRGYNARSGEELWRWDPIPKTAERAHRLGWQLQQAQRTGAANAWAPLAADAERDIVYIPTGSAAPDFYGGERLGDNKWANSIVALRASTGNFLWGYQLVHHDVWDYDTSVQPTLVELERDGVSIPAVLIANKTGFIYSFNRLTGEPIFPIHETAVPQGGVAGEQLSPTQPIPTLPPAVSRQQPFHGEDAWGMFLLDEYSCAEKLEGLRSEGIFTPPSLAGSVSFPGYGGGINWGGIAFDPDRQIAIINSNELPTQVTLVERETYEELEQTELADEAQFTAQAGTPYGMWRRPLLSMLGTPCSEPPWGQISAVDMREGKILWQRPLGTIEDIVPAIVPNLNLGTPLMGGPIVTASGLIFVAAAMDNYLRALDIQSGETRWQGRLPAGGQATPMTYYLESTGKQYVVIAAGGHPGLGTTPGDYLVAFALGK